MGNNKILCSTGVFIGRINNGDHTLIKKIAPRLHCDGLELMMYHTAEWIDTVTPIFDELDGYGIRFYTMHMSKNIGELISRNEDGDIAHAVTLFERNCRLAVRYGIEILVLHLWGGVYSDRQIDRNIELFGKLHGIAAGYGLTLTVENIVCNTEKPLKHMRALCEKYPADIKFTIDVRQAEFHKSLRETCESDFIWGANRAAHIHISDYKGGEMDWSKLNPVLAPGLGDVDFGYFFDFLEQQNYGGYLTLESSLKSEDGVFIDLINESLDFIRANYH